MDDGRSQLTYIDYYKPLAQVFEDQRFKYLASLFYSVLRLGIITYFILDLLEVEQKCYDYSNAKETTIIVLVCYVCITDFPCGGIILANFCADFSNRFLSIIISIIRIGFHVAMILASIL